MTRQALDFYRSYPPPGFHDVHVAMIRTTLADCYADPHLPCRLRHGRRAAANANALVSAATVLAGSPARTVTGVSPLDEAIGSAGKAFNAVLRYAKTHDQDGRTRMHEELGDGRRRYSRVDLGTQPSFALKRMTEEKE